MAAVRRVLLLRLPQPLRAPLPLPAIRRSSNPPSPLPLPAIRSLLGSPRFLSDGSSLEIDLSNGESKRRLIGRLLYRSKQRGFLELDLVLGKWVEENIHSMDKPQISALVEVLDLESPDLWKWISGQEQPPDAVNNNPVFNSIRAKVFENLNHANPNTRAAPGKPWVRGWDDIKKGKDGPMCGNQ